MTFFVPTHRYEKYARVLHTKLHSIWTDDDDLILIRLFHSSRIGSPLPVDVAIRCIFCSVFLYGIQIEKHWILMRIDGNVKHRVWQTHRLMIMMICNSWLEMFLAIFCDSWNKRRTATIAQHLQWPVTFYAISGLSICASGKMMTYDFDVLGATFSSRLSYGVEKLIVAFWVIWKDRKSYISG